MDGIEYKVRDEGGCGVWGGMYNVLGINKDGEKEVVGMYICKNEGGKLWVSVVRDVEKGGVEDIVIGWIDGLKGFGEGIESVYGKSWVEVCIVDEIGNWMKYVGWKKEKELVKDLKWVYEGVNKECGENEVVKVDEKWGEEYGMVMRWWEEKWDKVCE